MFLWLTNIAIPEASSLMNDDILPLGGWLVNTSKDLSVQEDLTLSIAFPYKNRNQKNYRVKNYILFFFLQLKKRI
ncbi:hypothetical protein ACFSQ7_11195 [Paenibacillus rhizoplanae]